MKEKFIKEIIKESIKALDNGEVPVGCIIVKDNIIISRAHNMVENKRSAIYHAEIIAINKASKKINNWRLNGCEMYVTLEPCKMCEYAIKLSRIEKVYYLLKRDDNLKKENKMIKIDNYDIKYKKILQNFFISIRK